MVSLAHWWLAQLLPDVRIGEGSAERMPKRIEVAYVRELAQAAPPPAAPVVAKRTPARRAPAVTKPAPAASAASAPEAAVEPSSEPLSRRQDEARMARARTTRAAGGNAARTRADRRHCAGMRAASAAAAFEWPPSTRLSYRCSGNYRGEVTGGAQVEWVRVGTRYQVHLDVWVGAQAAPLVGRRMSSDGELSDEGLVPQALRRGDAGAVSRAAPAQHPVRR